MALAGGSHVKLGAYELTLATDISGHYVHSYQSLFANRLDVSGAPGQQGLRPELLVWSFTDWSGGEGNKFYDRDRPNVYYKGVANGRSPGELTAPPDRSFGTKTADSTPNRILFTASGGKLYMAAGCGCDASGHGHFWESTDGTTWTVRDSGYTTTNDIVTGLTSDGTYVYLVNANGTNPTANRYVSRFNTTDNSNTAFTTSTAGNAYFGLAFLPIAAGGRLYGWNGRVLVEWDTTDTSLPVAPTVLYTTALDTVPTGARGDIVAAQNSVVFYYSMEGKSYLMEYGLGAQAGARPLWNPPQGFVIKQIAYQLGTVFCLGDYAGKTAMFGISLVSRQSVFLGYIRPQTTLGEADLSASFGADLLALSTSGHLFVYNAASDAVSELADLSATSGTFAAVTTYKNLRVAAKYSTTTITTYTWSHDDATLSTTIGSAPESPVWNFDLPLVDKVLYGFHVSSTTLDGSGNNVTIAYDLDETGSYTSLTTLTSGKTNFSELSSSASFRQMRFRITTAGTAKVFAVAAVVGVLGSTETWDLVIDLRPDALNRSKTQADRPDQIRNSLLKAKETKASLTFRDGVPFVKQTNTAWDGTTLADISTSGYRTYTVAIEEVEDHADAKTSYGLMHVRLRKVELT